MVQEETYGVYKEIKKTVQEFKSMADKSELWFLSRTSSTISDQKKY
jgi:hypothetical protein